MYSGFQHIVHSAMFRSIGLALFYSGIQGIFLCLAAGIVIVLTRTSLPKFRYNLLTTGFAGFALLPLAFFGWKQIFHGSNQFPAQGISLVEDNRYLSEAVNVFARGSKWIADQSGTFCAIWFTVTALLAIRFFSRYLSVGRMMSASRPLHEWDEEIGTLCKRRRFFKLPAICENDSIEVPMLVGHFSPAILLPRGIKNKMSKEEISVIILHELAHAWRNDYLVNLWQTILETMLWFNPAAWWISKRIRIERENCCDDLVVQECNRPEHYLRSLIKFEELRTGRFSMAMALAGGRNGTLKRITRIVAGKNDTLAISEWAGLCGVMLIALLWFAAPARVPQNPSNSTVSSQTQAERAAKQQAEAADLIRRRPWHSL